jgi:hypothetical protein
MIMRKVLLVSWILVFTSGCATFPFQEGKKILKERKFLAKEYLQEGKKLRMDDMIFHLKQYEHAKDKISTGEGWMYSAALTGGTGSFLLAFNLIDNNRGVQTRDTQLIVGAGLMVLSIISGYISDKYINDGIDQYNEQHVGKKTSMRESGVGLQVSIKL